MKQAIALAAVLLLLSPAAALAKCAAPGAFFAPESGGTVPANPTIFFFSSTWRAEKTELVVLDGAGKPRRFTSTPIEGAPALVVRKLRVEATSGEVLLELRDARHPETQPLRARYTVGPVKPRASGRPVEILGVEAEASAWTCSWQSTRNLTPSVVAPAYRVEWAASEADFRAGRRETLVLPSRMERFFHRGDQPFVSPAAGQLELGHVNCTGKTFDWKGPIWVGVAALFEDGTEDPAVANPVRLEPPPAATGKGAP